MSESIPLSLSDVHALASATLRANGLSDEQTQALADTVTAAERDGCKSHGLFRIPAYVQSARNGLANKSHITFGIAAGVIFGVKKYADTLLKVVDRHQIDLRFQHELIALDPGNRQATFKNMDSGEEVSWQYDMIHVTPPMSAPDFLKQSKLAASTGWVEVDPHTTQHVRYSNVFSLGDCSNLPTSKTGAAIRKQAPTTVANLTALINGRQMMASYDGYTSCPLVTGYGRLVLAEFDYDKVPQESFPFDQSQERYSMYALKAYGLPRMYWHGMLRGREF